jgi:multidrug efflux system membrane fusion protein
MRPLVLLVLVCLAGPVPAALAQGGGPPPTRVVTDPVREEVLGQQQLVIGTLRAVRRAVLAVETEGLLAEQPLREGDSLRRGDVVARTDATLLRLEVQRAEAQLVAARATVQQQVAVLAKAERDLPRLQRLLAESAAVSQTVVDDAGTALAEARARLANARANVAAAGAAEALARERLKDADVHAPFDGHVVTRRAEVGEWLRAGDAVVEIVASDPIEAWLAVPEEALRALSAPGALVEVHVPATGHVERLPITTLVPDVDPLAHTFPLVVRLPNDDGMLRPGLRAVARVPTGVRAPTLTVHADALLRDAAGERVLVAASGVARAVRVETLFLAGGRVAVRGEGLHAGDLAIVEGNERLSPGQPVAPAGT